MSRRTKRSSRSGRRKPPASGRKPSTALSQRDVDMSADELVSYHRLFQPLFQRREQRQWSAFYLCGQLANLERKTIEPMVLALKGPDPNAMRAVQQFIGSAAWDVQPILEQQQQLVAEWLGEPEGVVIVDGSGFPKRGSHSVGVGHQYCGHVGKVANCQEGVFAVYVSTLGYTFLDGRLYLPEDWWGDDYRERWQRCGIPDGMRFQTEPELALERVRGLAMRNVVPFRWVAADEHFGQNPAFLDGVAALHKWYLAEVPADTRVWLRTPAVELPGRGLFGRPRTRPRVARHAPRPAEMRELAARLPKSAWSRRMIKEGSQGPLVAEFAVVRVTTVRDKLPGPRVWAVFRRSLGAQPEIKFYLSNAPTTCPQSELVRLSGLRWPIETAIEEAKGEVGMDHYETRSWSGWHHHMVQTFLAHLFLMHLRLTFKKKPSTHYSTSASTRGAGYRRRQRPLARYPAHCPLPAAAQSRRLSLTSQTHSPTTSSAGFEAPQAQSLGVG